MILNNRDSKLLSYFDASRWQRVTAQLKPVQQLAFKCNDPATVPLACQSLRWHSVPNQAL